MGLSECITKLNNSPNALSEKELSELNDYISTRKGENADGDISERLALRDFAKSINDRMNIVRGALGIEAQEITDNFSVPTKIVKKQEAVTETPEVSESIPLTTEKETVNEEGLSRTDRFRKAVQDQSIKLKRVQEEVSDVTGSDVTGTDMDAYNALDLEKNKMSAKAVKIIEDTITSNDSFTHRARKEGVSFDETEDKHFGKYLYAKHAKERNARIRAIGDEQIKSLMYKNEDLFSELDKLQKEESPNKSKIQSIKKQISKIEDNLDQVGVKFEVAGSGMTDAEADAFMSSLSAKEEASYSKYEKEFRERFVSRLLSDRVESGIISKEQAKKFSIFENYVPLKVEEFESIKNSEPISTSSGDRKIKGKTVFGSKKGLKGIKGYDATAKRVNPFIATISELQSIQGDIARNNILLSFEKLATESGVKIADVTIKPAIPKTIENKFGLKEVMMTLPDGFNENNSIRFYKDGKMMYMKVDDKDLYSAIAQSNQVGSWIYKNRVLRGFSTVFRNINTTLSPEFIATNFFRDFQAAAVSANLEMDSFSITKFMKETAKVGSAMTVRNAKSLTGKDLPKGEYQTLIDEYEASGAKISWSALGNMGEIGNTLNEVSGIVNADGTSSKPMQVAKGIVKFMESASDVAEHTSRIAVYKMAKEEFLKKGDPNAERKAAILAKEVTVNFNRRGEIGNALNTLYIFANAGFQGTSRMAEAVVKSKKVQAIAGGLFMLGIAEGYLNDAVGDDDDDYFMLDEWRKERYLSFKQKGGPMYQIPLPYGWSVFKYAGSKTYEMMKGQNSPYDGVVSILKSAMTNFSPIGGATPAQLSSPTITDPIIQVWENIDHAGNPIFKDSFGRTERVRSEAGKTRTDEIWKKVAEGLNKLSGGSAAQKGWIDYEPEVYRHYVQSYGGGSGRFIGRMITSSMNVTSKEGSMSFDDTPFVRSFIRDIPKTGDLKLAFDMMNKSQTTLFEADEVDAFEISVEQAAKKETLDMMDALDLKKSFMRNQFTLKYAIDAGISYDEARKMMSNN
jgi:hypothetical protein